MSKILKIVYAWNYIKFILINFSRIIVHVLCLQNGIFKTSFHVVGT